MTQTDSTRTPKGSPVSAGSALESWAKAAALVSINIPKSYWEDDAAPPTVFEVSSLSIGIRFDPKQGQKYVARLESDDGTGWENMILWGGLADDYDAERAVMKCLREAIKEIGPKPDGIDKAVKSSLRKLIQILQNDKILPPAESGATKTDDNE